jgi:hypothetical protein
MQHTVSILAGDLTVSVDGESYRCLDAAELPPGLISISWTPLPTTEDGKLRDPRKLPGYIHQHGDSHGFDNPALLVPYMHKWTAAKAAYEKEAAAKKVLREAEEVKWKAEREAFEAEQKKLAAAMEARKDFEAAALALAASDHEVIKAAEALLSEAGKLDPATVAKRRALRATAKAEKVKLGI